MRCSACKSDKYEIKNKSISCISCGLIASSDVRIFQIVRVNGVSLEDPEEEGARPLLL